MTDARPTPAPATLDFGLNENGFKAWWVIANDGGLLATCKSRDAADCVLRAVNHHDALVEALREACFGNRRLRGGRDMRFRSCPRSRCARCGRGGGDEMNVPEFETVEAMRKYGGSFVKALAECFYRADGQNFAILKGAFGHYWREYEAIAENRRAAAKETPSQEDSKS